MTTPARRKSTDFAAALTGLVVGGCILFATLFGIVIMTARSYPAESSAATSSH